MSRYIVARQTRGRRAASYWVIDTDGVAQGQTARVISEFTTEEHGWGGARQEAIASAERLNAA